MRRLYPADGLVMVRLTQAARAAGLAAVVAKWLHSVCAAAGDPARLGGAPASGSAKLNRCTGLRASPTNGF